MLLPVLDNSVFSHNEIFLFFLTVINKIIVANVAIVIIFLFDESLLSQFFDCMTPLHGHHSTIATWSHFEFGPEFKCYCATLKRQIKIDGKKKNERNIIAKHQ